jgi:hypothetical protein
MKDEDHGAPRGRFPQRSWHVGEPLYHASLTPEEYRTLLKSAGFRVVAHVVEDPNCGGHTIWLAQAEH